MQSPQFVCTVRAILRPFVRVPHSHSFSFSLFYPFPLSLALLWLALGFTLKTPILFATRSGLRGLAAGLLQRTRAWVPSPPYPYITNLQHALVASASNSF